MYHIAAFPSASEDTRDEVEIIYDGWILPDRSSSYFPPFMRTKLKNALRNQMPANPNWEVYKIK